MWAHLLEETYSIWGTTKTWKGHRNPEVSWKFFPGKAILWKRSSKQMTPNFPNAPESLYCLSKRSYSWPWLVHVSRWVPSQTSDLEIPRSHRFHYRQHFYGWGGHSDKDTTENLQVKPCSGPLYHYTYSTNSLDATTKAKEHSSGTSKPRGFTFSHLRCSLLRCCCQASCRRNLSSCWNLRSFLFTCSFFFKSACFAWVALKAW